MPAMRLNLLLQEIHRHCLTKSDRCFRFRICKKSINLNFGAFPIFQFQCLLQTPNSVFSVSHQLKLLSQHLFHAQMGFYWEKREPFSIQLQSFQTTGKQQAMLFWLKTTLLALRANLGFYRSVDVLFARVSRIAPLLLINLGAYIHTVTKKYILALNQSFI